MLDYILYQYTAGGTAVVKGEVERSVELLGVVSNQVGVYEVKARGQAPVDGDVLILPVKGSKQLSLALPVKSVTSLITPIDGWSAECDGPALKEFQLRTVEVCCDGCGHQASVEFLQFSPDFNADALRALSMLGWQADEASQNCPTCVGDSGAKHE